jgi:hypothetical protein
MTDTLAWLFAAPFILLGAWSVWAWLKTAFAARARRRRARIWEDDNQYNPEQ